MKSLLNIRYIYKVNSSRLSKSKWNLSLNRANAIKNNELIGLSSSTATRMIDRINGEEDVDKEITELKQEIKLLNKIKFKTDEQLVSLKNKIHELQRKNLISDIVFVVMDSKKDYDRANKSFVLNGIEYVRLVATSGGVKKSTIIYANKEIHDELYKWMNNDRDMTKMFVPAKLESYIGLSFSSSVPVSNPKGVCVVHDVETVFNDDVILIDGNGRKYPKIETVKDYETKLNVCDGMGMMMPSLAKRWSEEMQEGYVTSGVCMRNAFLKGMAYTFDFQQFAKEIAKTEYITDVWGNVHNINNIELVVTTSMLKLWDSYSSIEHYLDCCERNHYEFALTKLIDEELDNEQTMNYQFLQSLKLSDEDIYNLCKPTIDEFHDVLGGDYRKTLLFLRGQKMNKENVLGNMNDFTSALMVDETLLEDKYVYSKIRNAIKKRIDDAKMGVIKVKGNFSLIAGDPYLLCESMFGLKLKGLLKKGEFYSNYWSSRNVSEIVAMRAPMTNKENVVIRDIVATDEMKKWYKYMPCVTILNGWDNTCDALCGADKDGDTFFTTNNKYVLKGADKNVLPIVCVQSSSSKKVPTEKDFIHANKLSFGSEIGSITNFATSMINVMSNFKEDSLEYKELEYRIKCMQDFQQNSIDKSKGIVARPVPKEWYDYKINKIDELDSDEIKSKKEFNLSILANKKPYFFIYNYQKLKSEWNDYKLSSNDFCLMKFDCTIEELIKKEGKTEDEQGFINSYYKMSPVNLENCVMNKIVKLFEMEFDTNTRHRTKGFDKEKFKSSLTYSKEEFELIKESKKKFDTDSKILMKNRLKGRNGDYISNDINRKETLFYEYKNMIMAYGIDKYKLCNIIVDLCYTSDKSKQFAWMLVGDIMIENLIKNTGNKIKFPIRDKNGGIDYCGEKYSMLEVNINENNL